MHPQEAEELRETRSRLWQRACMHKITVEELYEALARLRKLAGDDLYLIARLGRAAQPQKRD